MARRIKGRPGLSKVPTMVRGKTKVFIREQQKRIVDKVNKLTKGKGKKDKVREETLSNLVDSAIKADRKIKDKFPSSKELPKEQRVFIGNLPKERLIERVNSLMKDPEVQKLFKSKEHPDDPNIKILGYSAITGGLYDLYQKYPELLELRGLIVRTNDKGEITDIIARPYPKFFNHGETEAIAFDKLPWDKAGKIVVAEKYDGSLIIGYKNPKSGEADIATKGSFGSTQGNKAKEQMNSTEEGKKVKKLIQDLDEKGYTPLFEYVDKDMRLAVKYDESFMVLTGVRNKETGEFLDYDAMKAIGERYGVRVAKQYEFKNKEELLDYINKQENFEGVVARFDFNDGSLIVKVKSDWYFKNFRILNTLGGSLGEQKQTPIYAMDAIVAGEIDDIINKLPKDIKEKVEFIKKELNNELQTLYDKYTSGKAPKSTKKKINRILKENGIKDVSNLDFDTFVKYIYPHYRQNISSRIKKKMKK